jgi:hypothetical protein|tara:strand:+ start:149 stop:433 length:285 start_codon:yes stop_codon:yes gene_type:complete
MSKFLDYVEQPDGSFKWQMAEIPAVKSTQNVEPEPVVKSEPKEKLSVQKETTADFESMSKKQLETYARTIGIELDRRHNKAELIAEIEKFTSPD